jgi:hypothetical protein
MTGVVTRLSFCSSIPDALSLARPYFDKLHRNNKRVERIQSWRAPLLWLSFPLLVIGPCTVGHATDIAEMRRWNSSQRAVSQLLGHFAHVEGDVLGLSPAYLA